MLSDYPGELEESQQKGHRYTQRCDTNCHRCSNLPHRGPTEGLPAATSRHPQDVTLVFCPHNHLTVKQLCLKELRKSSTPIEHWRKNFSSVSLIYHLIFILESSCITIFLHLISPSPPSLSPKTTTVSLLGTLLILSWTFKIRVEPQKLSKILTRRLFWVEHLDTVLDRWSQEACALASLCGLSRNLQVIHNTGYGCPQPLHHESPLRLYSLLLYFSPWLRVDSNPFSGPIIQFSNPINEITQDMKHPHWG